MTKEEMARAKMERQFIEMVTDLAMESGFLENDGVPNELKTNMYGVKIRQLLCEIEDRATDDDVILMRQLYEALDKKENGAEAPKSKHHNHYTEAE